MNMITHFLARQETRAIAGKPPIRGDMSHPQTGAGEAEYAVSIALIALAVIVVIQGLGPSYGPRAHLKATQAVTLLPKAVTYRAARAAYFDELQNICRSQGDKRPGCAHRLDSQVQ